MVETLVESEELVELISRANSKGHPEIGYAIAQKLRDGEDEDEVLEWAESQLDPATNEAAVAQREAQAALRGASAVTPEPGGDGDYGGWKGDALRAELARRELPTSGTNPEMVARLEQDDADQDDGDEDDDGDENGDN